MRSAKALSVASVVLLSVVLLASPVFAEGYNKGGEIDSSEGWGSLSADDRLQYRVDANPHGGYTTTTNKCQDCHSTHYALGSYKLLRADTREAACDFCHGGGGGSSKNIMMDNAYTATAADMVSTLGPAADATTTSGFGTGHTLGYKGNAPDDIRPAYSESAGFSCFNCHSPHGNSARVMTTFWAPGREVVPRRVMGYTVHYKFNYLEGYMPVEVYVQTYTAPPPFMEDVTLKPADLIARDAGEPANDFDVTGETWGFVWGIEDATQNISVKTHSQLLGIAAEYGDINPDIDVTDPAAGVVSRRPIFATGKFLLLKNPDNEDAGGKVGDLEVSTTPLDNLDVVTDGNNKVAIDWDDPLGPAVSVPAYESQVLDPETGEPPLDINGDPIVSFFLAGLYQTGATERFPAPPYFGSTESTRSGMLTVGEFCTDCHDGAAGLSSQAAEVWHPDSDDYIVAYAHDSAPRGCDRQMILNPDDDANFGPECRKCHSGAASCSQCHADPEMISHRLDPFETGVIGATAYTTDTGLSMNEGLTTFEAQPSFTNVRNSTYNSVDVDAACLDGGFSFPHRTLGVNMLKDALYGVDFDGAPLGPGETRGDGLTLGTLPGADPGDDGVTPPRTYLADELVNASTDNLDSACIDCHNPNIWNGDNPSFEISQTVSNWWAFDSTGEYYERPGMADSWDVVGWDLLLKGLP